MPAEPYDDIFKKTLKICKKIICPGVLCDDRGVRVPAQTSKSLDFIYIMTRILMPVTFMDR